MRRIFPYFATLLVVLVLAAVFALRPTPFISVTAEAMADSLQGKVPTAGTASCDETGEDEWRCETADSSGGHHETYEVSINGFGCWTATPADGGAEVGTPTTLTGCITLLDH